MPARLLLPPSPPPQALMDAQFAELTEQLTRRRFLGGLGGVTVAAGLTAGLVGCSSGRSEATAAATHGAGWRFTDDRGATVDLPTRPRRIAFLTDTVTSALWAAGLRPVAAFSSDDVTLRSVGLDLGKEGITQIGSKDFQLNLEALVGTRPDLLIDAIQQDGTLQTAGTNAQVKQIAPIIGVNMYRSVEHIVGQAERLTSSLGEPLTDVSAKATYLAAAARLRAATRANPEIRVGFVFDISPSELGLMNPSTWAVLQTVAALGVRLVPVPASSSDTYSQGISWEKVPEIPADLLVWAVADPLPVNPLWSHVPAVRAGQLWEPDLASWYTYSYANFAGLLSGLAQRISAAKPGIGPIGATK
jgi:iron complex transport system substrate-binding protein